jgi:hypothetical protein
MGQPGQGSTWSTDPPTTGSTQEIRVDAKTLTAFANTIRADFEHGVAPVANRVQLAFANGAVVGANNPSADLQTMLETYDNCLGAMSQQLIAYAEFADTLTKAAHTIAARYTTSDQLAGASALAVQAAFDKADSGQVSPSSTAHVGMEPS